MANPANLSAEALLAINPKPTDAGRFIGTMSMSAKSLPLRHYPRITGRDQDAASR